MTLSIRFAVYCFLPASLAVLGLVSVADSSVNTGSPHGRADRCNACHATDPPSALELKGTDELCLSCHDGVTAPSEPHPIARPASTATAETPSDWPTLNGKLACLTCHDVLDGCRQPTRAAASNPNFLRGGVTERREAFCARCHHADDNTKYNPHAQRSIESGQGCDFCHSRSFADTYLRRRGEPHLVSDEISLCGACHTQHVDYFEPGHMAAKVTTEIAARIATAGRRRGLNGDGKRILPVTPDGKVVCSTCHNPHAVGVFPEDSILAVGAMVDGGREPGVSLRMPVQQLCSTCHGP